MVFLRSHSKLKFIMKKSISIIAAVIMAVIFTNQAHAQEFQGLDKSPMDQAAYPASYRVSKGDLCTKGDQSHQHLRCLDPSAF